MSILVLLLVLGTLIIISYLANAGYHQNVVLKDYNQSSKTMSVCLYSLCIFFVVVFACYIHLTDIYTRPSVWASTIMLIAMSIFLLWRIVQLLKVKSK